MCHLAVIERLFSSPYLELLVIHSFLNLGQHWNEHSILTKLTVSSMKMLKTGAEIRNLYNKIRIPEAK